VSGTAQAQPACDHVCIYHDITQKLKVSSSNFSITHSFFVNNVFVMSYMTAVAQWLRCCATNRKVAGSIPAGVIGIFH